MGEARRKRLQQIAAEKVLQQVDMQALSSAVHKVVAALTPQSGLDCVWYAKVGAAVLSHLGIDARATAGQAAWRVGTGAGDVISHMQSPNTTYFAPAGQNAAMYHAWIELPSQGYLLDFSTRTLKRKAELLDEADGGLTIIDWAPEFLLVPGTSCAKSHDVTNGYRAGLYVYQPSEVITSTVMAPADGCTPEEHANDVARLADAALIAYRQIRRGIDFKVIGVGADDEQHEDNAPSPPLRPL